MHSNNGFNSMLTTTPDLTRRTPEACLHFNIRPTDVASFHVDRPVLVMRSGTPGSQRGITLDWSPTGGRNWQVMSFHESVADAIRAFHTLPPSKSRNPLHYRILHES